MCGIRLVQAGCQKQPMQVDQRAIGALKPFVVGLGCHVSRIGGQLTKDGFNPDAIPLSGCRLQHHRPAQQPALPRKKLRAVRHHGERQLAFVDRTRTHRQREQRPGLADTKRFRLVRSRQCQCTAVPGFDDQPDNPDANVHQSSLRPQAQLTLDITLPEPPANQQARPFRGLVVPI